MTHLANTLQHNCTTCGDSFSDAKYKTCPPCRQHSRESSKKHYAQNKEKIAQSHSQYRADNPEKIAESSARYYAEHKEGIAERGAQYRADNPEKIAESSARYYAEHKEKLAKYGIEYRAEHKEKLAKYGIEYRAEHKDKLAENRAQHRAEHKEKIAESHAQYRAEIKKKKVELAVAATVGPPPLAAPLLLQAIVNDFMRRPEVRLFFAAGSKAFSYFFVWSARCEVEVTAAGTRIVPPSAASMLACEKTESTGSLTANADRQMLLGMPDGSGNAPPPKGSDFHKQGAFIFRLLASPNILDATRAEAMAHRLDDSVKGFAGHRRTGDERSVGPPGCIFALSVLVLPQGIEGAGMCVADPKYAAAFAAAKAGGRTKSVVPPVGPAGVDLAGLTVGKDGAYYLGLPARS
jgi:hypothetical protein